MHPTPLAIEYFVNLQERQIVIMIVIRWPSYSSTHLAEGKKNLPIRISTPPIMLLNRFLLVKSVSIPVDNLSGHLNCFVANSLVLIFLGLFCICAILIAFSISGGDGCSFKGIHELAVFSWNYFMYP